MLRYSDSPRGEVEQQVDYFIAAPAHALAYPIGAREFEYLRRSTEQRLGRRFDIRQFHDVVLLAGPLPLTVLAEVVRRWIDNPTSH